MIVIYGGVDDRRCQGNVAKSVCIRELEAERWARSTPSVRCYRDDRWGGIRCGKWSPTTNLLPPRRHLSLILSEPINVFRSNKNGFERCADIQRHCVTRSCRR